MLRFIFFTSLFIKVVLSFLTYDEIVIKQSVFAMMKVEIIKFTMVLTCPWNFIT